MPTPACTVLGHAPLATLYSFQALLALPNLRGMSTALSPCSVPALPSAVGNWMHTVCVPFRHWEFFSLYFLKITYVQLDFFFTVAEYRVNIFMELFILTPRHGFSPSNSQVRAQHCLWMQGWLLLTCVTQPSTTLRFICCFTRQLLAT